MPTSLFSILPWARLCPCYYDRKITCHQVWISYLVAILLPCLNIRDKGGDVLSALSRKCKWSVRLRTGPWEVLKDSLRPPSQPWSTPPQRIGTFENWSLEPLIFEWLCSIFLIAQLIHFFGIYLLSTHTAQKLNVFQSAMSLSSGSLHSNERPSHNTCYHMVIVYAERGRPGYLHIVQQA